MKRLLLVTAVLVAAVAVFVVTSLPPARLRLSTSPADGSVPGILHIHSNRSDGRGTPDEIAAAAAAAGLKFIVLTDHGDATRTPDPPIYRSGVLCLDGVEISTSGGHYIAIDMPASPYPLGGEARDVIDDVRRLGGFGIAAHPDSPKAELRWREWVAPFDGIEILNPDTSWRQWVADTSRRARWQLFRTVLAYPFRGPEAITSLIHPTGIRYQWNALVRRRRVVTVAGADAHANIELRNGDAGGRPLSVPLPSYQASFRTISIHVRTERPLSGEAAADAAVVLRAIRAGHLYAAVDGAATPPSFEFTASNDNGTVGPGDQITDNGPLTLRVRSNAPPGFTATVWNGATAVAADRREPEFSLQVPPGPATYWVEIRATGRLSDVPWITSNPVYVRPRDFVGVRPAVRSPASRSVALLDPRATDRWRVEQDPASLGAVDVLQSTRGPEVRWRFGLGGGTPASQYAALVLDTPEGLAAADRLSFVTRAERPARIDVQLRSGDGRWQRSVYVDTFNQERTVFFDELTPIGETGTWKPPLEKVRSILFVIDLTHAKPGASGRVWISEPRLQ